MKIEKIRELKNEELEQRQDELTEEIFRARIQKETGQLDQMGKIRNLRRDLARVKTVLREREREAQPSRG
ncbi:MAG TPA: 50S ribosomal protein L29 [Vicinamibacteria bacterium]